MLIQEKARVTPKVNPNPNRNLDRGICVAQGSLDVLVEGVHLVHRRFAVALELWFAAVLTHGLG